jgi:hypothetical protein
MFGSAVLAALLAVGPASSFANAAGPTVDTLSGSWVVAADAKFTQADINNRPRYVVEQLLGAKAPNIIALKPLYSLPSAILFGVALYERPIETPTDHICSLHKLSIELTNLPLHNDRILVLSPTGRNELSLQYFSAPQTGSCAINAMLPNLFSAPSLETAARGYHLLSEAVQQASEGHNLRISCLNAGMKCDGYAILEKYSMTEVESYVSCEQDEEACIEVQEHSYFGGPGWIIKLFGKTRLERVELNGVMRPVI